MDPTSREVIRMQVNVTVKAERLTGRELMVFAGHAWSSCDECGDDFEIHDWVDVVRGVVVQCDRS